MTLLLNVWDVITFCFFYMLLNSLHCFWNWFCNYLNIELQDHIEMDFLVMK